MFLRNRLILILSCCLVYINHRPAFGLDPQQINWSFKTLSLANGIIPSNSDVDGEFSTVAESISRGDLFALVQNKGEHMTEYELGDVLVSLLGYNVEDECGEKTGLDAEMVNELIGEGLPENITMDHFVGHLLGLEIQSNQQSTTTQGDAVANLKGGENSLGLTKRGFTTEQTLLSEMTIPEFQSSATLTD